MQDNRQSSSDEACRVKLSPEHAERVKRIAAAEGKTPEQVVADALTILWVRHATKHGW